MTENQARSDTRPPGVDSDEKSTLLAFLDYLREAVVAKAQGLDSDGGRRPGVPSGTSLLGLIKHLTAAEVYWFSWAYDGADVAVPSFRMELVEADGEETVVGAYRDAIKRSNEIIEGCGDLGQPCTRVTGKDSAARSMRWVLVHMIEETARHAGHADILREQADGSIGR